MGILRKRNFLFAALFLGALFAGCSDSDESDGPQDTADTADVMRKAARMVMRWSRWKANPRHLKKNHGRGTRRPIADGLPESGSTLGA